MASIETQILASEYQKHINHLEEKIGALTEKLLEAFEELNIFYDLSQSLGNIFNVKDICDIALFQIAEIVCSEKASISLIDKDREYLTIVSYRGFKDNPTGQKIKIKDTLYSKAIERRKPILAEDLNYQFGTIHKRRQYKTNSFILHPICTLPMTVSEEVIGVISLADKTDKSSFTAQDIKFLSAVTSQVSMVIQNARLVTNLKESFLITVRSLSAAIDAKDSYTYGHSDRVSEYALSIGQILGISQKDLEKLELACLLHDIGKISIPENILNKKEKLTLPEMEIIHIHPLKGEAILRNTNYDKAIMAAVRNHHERYDGQGYPDGLEGEKISLMARIIAVADSFDAMTSDRPYRSRRSHQEAAKEIHKEAGSKYDSKVVWAFVKWITGQTGDICLT